MSFVVRRCMFRGTRYHVGWFCLCVSHVQEDSWMYDTRFLCVLYVINPFRKEVLVGVLGEVRERGWGVAVRVLFESGVIRLR